LKTNACAWSGPGASNGAIAPAWGHAVPTVGGDSVALADGKDDEAATKPADADDKDDEAAPKPAGADDKDEDKAEPKPADAGDKDEDKDEPKPADADKDEDKGEPKPAGADGKDEDKDAPKPADADKDEDKDEPKPAGADGKDEDKDAPKPADADKDEDKDEPKPADKGKDDGEDAPKPADKDDKDGDKDATKAKEDEYAPYRRAVVRLETSVTARSPLCPNQKSEETETFAGSGFILENSDENGLVIVTNAHVVKDAEMIEISFPATSQEGYEAKTVAISIKWDIAIVTTTREVYDKIKADDHDLTVVKLAGPGEGKRSGADVVAIGFPLGTKSTTITTGTLSGSEEIDGGFVYQHTADISPGSSGSPLFIAVTNDKGETEYQVVGINFASSTEEHQQSNNYAVTSYKVNLLLQDYKGEVSGWDAVAAKIKSCHAQPVDCEHHVAPIGATSVVGSDGLYAALGDGCDQGVYLSKVEDPSILRSADPPVEAGVFLVSVEVAGEDQPVALDRFGDGKAEKYLLDTENWRELLFMTKDLKDAVTVRTCKGGAEQTHKLKLFCDPNAKNCPKPDSQQRSITVKDYERFANVTFVELDAELAITLVTKAEMFDYLPYVADAQGTDPKCSLKTKLAEQGAVIVSQAPEPDTVGAREDNLAALFKPGDIVDSVNGKPVNSLADLRAAAFGGEAGDGSRCDGSYFVVQTKGGAVYSVDYGAALRAQAQIGDTKRTVYHGDMACAGLTPHVRAQACKCGIDAECDKVGAEPEPDESPAPNTQQAAVAAAKKQDEEDQKDDTVPPETNEPEEEEDDQSFLQKKHVLPIEAKARDWGQARANAILAERLMRYRAQWQRRP